MKGDIVGSRAGEFNHRLTGNPKSVICGKFNPEGWPEPIEGAPMCSRCAGTHEVNPDSRPLPDNWVNKPTVQDEHWAYLAANGKTRRKGQY